jgi:energy-converting hydrogenase Eha subunit H
LNKLLPFQLIRLSKPDKKKNKNKKKIKIKKLKNKLMPIKQKRRVAMVCEISLKHLNEDKIS